MSPTAQASASRRPRSIPTPPIQRSSQPRACQSTLPKYQPVSPPMRRIGAKACAGGTSTTTRARIAFETRRCVPSSSALTNGRVEAASGSIRNAFARRRRPDDGRVLQPFDQRAADAGLRRRDQRQPQAGEMRRQHGHRQQQPAKSAQPGVPPHHVAVRDHLRAADFEQCAAGARHVERRAARYASTSSIAMGCVSVVDPARTDHHRQPLDERLNHLERQAAGANDDRRAKLDHRARRWREGVSRSRRGS